MQCYSDSCRSAEAADRPYLGCYSPSCPNARSSVLKPQQVPKVELPWVTKHPKRERKMSLFSQILAHPSGAFPTKTKIPPTTVISAMYMNKLPAKSQIKRLLEDTILTRYHRFSALPIEAQDGTISWLPYETINVESHMQSAEISSEADIKAYIENLFKRVWDSTKPMWHIHLLQSTTPGQPSVLIIELHHVLGDGVSQMQVLGDIVTDKAGKPLTLDEKKFKRMMQGNKPSPTLWQRVQRKAVLALNTGAAVAKVLSLPLLFGDTKTSLTVPYNHFASRRRAYVPVPPLPLDVIKDIKNKLHVTVNDVLLAILGGAMRSYLLHRNDKSLSTAAAAASLQIRALMPYSFPRSLDDLHNKWTMISGRVPVGESSPVARVQAAKNAMDKIKQSPEPVVAVFLQESLYRAVGHELSAQTNLDLFKKHTLIFTNVPGFTEEMYFCGEKIVHVQPIVSNVITQCSAVSYCGQVFMNFVVDADIIYEYDLLADFVVKELRAVALAAGVSTAGIPELQHPGEGKKAQ
ncbi:uncharacterized protein EV422DRAFT_200850 [Fimicolochytrium jonesii]|uniref:uncharacterized protein n=1 Tax=Fimicolochytrium jonesii TaxID=1396493 RepID=UPI0022FDF4C0|nr:uncharacterized protein EV422DRAFT_200850 [Fimicolochytrium jonesii]KAI8817980.1 hypothetical protein EV422DRAFT_200850 [Fimicolochytrium jonesii]